MAWLESHQTLANHPKLRRFMRALGVGKAAAIGHLHLLWYWALDYAGADGDITEYDAEEIAAAAEWDGDEKKLWEALRASGFIDVDPSTHSAFLHNWDDYAGKLQQRKQANRERMRAARAVEREQEEARAVKTPQRRAARAAKGEAATGEGEESAPVPPPAPKKTRAIPAEEIAGREHLIPYMEAYRRGRFEEMKEEEVVKVTGPMLARFQKTLQEWHDDPNITPEIVEETSRAAAVRNIDPNTFVTGPHTVQKSWDVCREYAARMKAGTAVPPVRQQQHNNGNGQGGNSNGGGPLRRATRYVN